MKIIRHHFLADTYADLHAHVRTHHNMHPVQTMILYALVVSPLVMASFILWQSRRRNENNNNNNALFIYYTIM